MKKIGLIGGTSWISTIDYYKYLNEGVNKILGEGQFAQCIIYSFNYGDIVAYNKAEDFESIYQMLEDASLKLQNAGADLIVLCANTFHMHADRLAKSISIPLIHIADATANAIVKKDIQTVGLLGTKFTMEQSFYKDRLTLKGIKTIIPSLEDRLFIHQTLNEELGSGILKASTKDRYLSIMQSLKENGAEGIVLGCTEIPLLIQQKDIDIPVFDTTKIHSAAIIEAALEGHF